MINQKGLHIVIGLGLTGFSCVRFLAERGIPVAVADTRSNPPYLAQLKQSFPDVMTLFGSLDAQWLDQAAVLVVSPGISLQEPAIARQIARDVPVIGDIELFAQAVTVPVVAITGTNAKSTVTTLVGQMMQQAGINVAVGGNLGVPALDLLRESKNAEVFVLELSSFQLDTTFSLAPKVATILNITPDHLDRYITLEAYIESKQRIYTHCEVVVSNKDDATTRCKAFRPQQELSFTLGEPAKNEFGLLTKQGKTYLAFQGQLLMPVQELPLMGKHSQANALAALAIGYGYGLAMEPMLQTLREFKGLPHRCQLVRRRNGSDWYNDSKGTNVGATLAAIEGLGSDIKGKLILIAGGLGKNADFAPLVPAIKQYVKTVILIGEAAPILADVIKNCVDVRFAKSMEEAVSLADELVSPGDSVLLSPACASYDMFKNFEHRGQVFSSVVLDL